MHKALTATDKSLYPQVRQAQWMTVIKCRQNKQAQQKNNKNTTEKNPGNT
jgi:hypothetical protein